MSTNRPPAVVIHAGRIFAWSASSATGAANGWSGDTFIAERGFTAPARVKREVREASIQVKCMGWMQFTLVAAAIVLGFAMIAGVMNFRINFF